MTAEQIISRLHLEPLDKEGGFYYQTYVSGEKISKEALPDRYGKDKSFSTAIYYLLTPDTKSMLHKLPSDEIYHFYLGDPVRMLQLHPNGNSSIIFLGSDIMAGQRLQITVPGGVWQGSSLVDGGEFALMGTTVSPGFDFDDFEAGNKDELIDMFPQHKGYIEDLS